MDVGLGLMVSITGFILYVLVLKFNEKQKENKSRKFAEEYHNKINSPDFIEERYIKYYLNTTYPLSNYETLTKYYPAKERKCWECKQPIKSFVFSCRKCGKYVCHNCGRCDFACDNGYKDYSNAIKKIIDLSDDDPKKQRFITMKNTHMVIYEREQYETKRKKLEDERKRSEGELHLAQLKEHRQQQLAKEEEEKRICLDEKYRNLQVGSVMHHYKFGELKVIKIDKENKLVHTVTSSMQDKMFILDDSLKRYLNDISL